VFTGHLSWRPSLQTYWHPPFAIQVPLFWYILFNTATALVPFNMATKRSGKKLWPYEISFDHDPSLGDYEIDEDGEQNWFIIGICGKLMRDGQEYYNVRYAGNHRGRTFDHLATDLEVSHPEHVEMWEEKWGEKYRRETSGQSHVL
jgi:hypothetical protein